MHQMNVPWKVDQIASESKIVSWEVVSVDGRKT